MVTCLMVLVVAIRPTLLKIFSYLKVNFVSLMDILLRWSRNDKYAYTDDARINKK